MKRFFPFSFILILSLIFNSIWVEGISRNFQSSPLGAEGLQEPDQPFKQPVSIKYTLPEALKGAVLKKVVADYNDIIYVLTDKGLYRVNDKDLIKDIRYTPLAQKIPVDIALQEETGYLYYLYEDKFLTNGYAGVPYKILPKGKYNKIAVAADGTVLLAGDKSIAVYNQDKLMEIALPSENLLNIYVQDGNFYGLSTKAVYRLSGDKFISIHKGEQLKALSFRNNEIILGTPKGYYGINKTTGVSTFPLQTKIPVEDINCLIVNEGNLWAGTAIGAFMKEASGGFRYYASKRWLNEDKVISMTTDSKGNVYMLTPTGLNKIEFVSQTLAQKTAYFEDKIRQGHIRYGFISNVEFQKPGDPSTAQLKDTDNDGLWSAFYLGSQAFRYAVTGDKDAKRYAWEAFEAFERLLSVNGLKGFPSRTFERKGFKNSDPDRWHDSPDQEWEWKGTTSSDEFVAYIWIASVLDEMVAQTEAEKKRVADFMDKILMHIIDNNYYFIDADGKPTLWGRWHPEYINWFPHSIIDRKLGSTTIIAGLQLGYALTGKELYKKEAFRLMNEHGYLENILVPCEAIQPTKGYVHLGVELGDGWNHSDDEMAFLTYWVLHKYALNDTLQQQFDIAIRNHWEIELPERNAVWNLVAKGTIGTYDKVSTLWQLHEFPMDLIRWDVKNSHRKDLIMLPSNLREQSTRDLLPPGEQPMHRHNANPFRLDGGEGGRTELAGDEYLLPYWMARYLKVLN